MPLLSNRRIRLSLVLVMVVGNICVLHYLQFIAGVHPARSRAPVSGSLDFGDIVFNQSKPDALVEELIQKVRRAEAPVLSIDHFRSSNKEATISCGGTTAMDFRTYEDIEQWIQPHRPEDLFNPNKVSIIAQAFNLEKSACHPLPACALDEPFSGMGKIDCAIVGNSGSLLASRLGKSIDSHQVIFRFNNAPTKTYEEFVGSKTNVRFRNGPYIQPLSSREITICQIRDPAVRAWAKGWALNSLNEYNNIDWTVVTVDNTKAKNEEVVTYILHPEYICLAWSAVHNASQKPSSGLVGVLVALNLCTLPLHLYGFAYERYFNQSIQPHYFDWERPKRGRENVHPFLEERHFLEKLQDMGYVRIYQ